jgi:hypothetical protein
MPRTIHSYLPTRDEIEAATAKIRAGWSEDVLRDRAGLQRDQVFELKVELAVDWDLPTCRETRARAWRSSEPTHSRGPRGGGQAVA